MKKEERWGGGGGGAGIRFDEDFQKKQKILISSDFGGFD